MCCSCSCTVLQKVMTLARAAGGSHSRSQSRSQTGWNPKGPAEEISERTRRCVNRDRGRCEGQQQIRLHIPEPAETNALEKAKFYQIHLNSFYRVFASPFLVALASSVSISVSASSPIASCLLLPVPLSYHCHLLCCLRRAPTLDGQVGHLVCCVNNVSRGA